MWTLKYNGEQKTFAEWGIRNVERTLISQDIDRVLFEQPVASPFDDPLFPEGGIVEIFKDETRWFYGRADDAAQRASGNTASLLYTISGPWWWLANMGFRQSWKIRPGGNPQVALVEQFSSYCLLGTKADGFGTQQTIADQIAEAVNYAIGQGAPLLFDGTGLPTIFPPVRDVWNAPVSEVIQKMIEWSPDIVCWFDYSTDPYPTLRMRRRADQEAVEIDLKEGVAEWTIKPRNDLKVPGVVIYYIRSDSANGSVYTVIKEEKVPAETTGREPKALLAAINLEGASITYVEASITCEAIEPLSADWWKRHDAHLQSDKIKDLKISSASYADEQGGAVTPLPRELFGTWSEWMGGKIQTICVHAKATWTEEVDLPVDGNAANKTSVLKVVDRPIVVSLVATDLTTGTYKSAPGGVGGDPQPVGLAETLFEALNTPHFEGQLALKEAQCNGRVAIGKVLNLNGGRSEWTSMRAQIQSVTESHDTGATKVTFGPPRLLGPTDYIALHRATRNRIRFASPESRTTGITGSSAAILPKTVSKQVATSGQGGITQMVLIDPRKTVPNGEPAKIDGRVDLNLSEASGKEVKLRQIKICDNNVERKMIVLCSEIYD